MRILKLHFSNLNSLRGSFSIDFTHAQYATAGIFLITGATGAGKSTILDAISLALYGRTPRLGTISESVNEIMSRGSGSCCASVEFESNGRRYCCTFRQKRARGQAHGKLQNPEMELSDVSQGSIILSRRISEIKTTQIATLTGMNYEHFTRSLLLAQGEFAKFLKSKADERGKLLERITGAEIYSQLSRAAHEIHKQKLQEIRLTQDLLERRHVLSDAERSAKQQHCAMLDEQRHDLACRIAAQEEALAWRMQLDENEQALAELDRLMLEQQRAQQHFRPQQARLDAALRAVHVRAEAAAFRSEQERLEQLTAQLQQASQAQPLLASELEDTERHRAQYASQLAAQERQGQLLTPLLEQVRELDSRIHALQEAQCSAQAAYALRTQQLVQAELCHAQSLKEHDTLAGSLEQIRHDYAHLAAAGTWLTAELAALKLRFKTRAELQIELQQSSAELARRHAAHQQSAAHLTTLADTVHAQQQHLQALQEKKGQAAAKLEELLDGQSPEYYELARQHAEQSLRLAETLKQLEERRRELREGVPCPLCGAEHHPYASAQLPQPAAAALEAAALTDLLRRIAVSREHLTALELEISQVQGQLAITNVEHARQEEECARLGQECSQLEARRAQLHHTAAACESELQESLAAHGLLDDAGTIPTACLAKLDTLLQNFNDLKAQKERISAELQLLQSQLAGQALQRDSSRIAAGEAEHALEQRNAELEEAQRARRALFGDQDPGTRAQDHHNQIQETRRELQHAATHAAELQARLAALNTQLADLKGQQQERQQALEHAQAALHIALHAHGFAALAAYDQALLDPGEIARLQAEQTRLQSAGDRLKGQLQERRNAHELLLAARKTQLDRSTLQQDLAALRDQKTTCDQQWGALRQELDLDTQARHALQAEQALLRQKQADLQRYSKLRELIGSQDGKILRNYVQSLTFRNMLTCANEQIQMLSDRYLLIPRADAPLELDVMDSYEANAIRSAANLSGGESFLVSLALALSLSKLSSGKARVDSIFLDEGFGTLDANSLNIALTALGALHHQHQLIGIISHVRELRERIAAQINVLNVKGGCSTLSGPGVCAAPG